MTFTIIKVTVLIGLDNPLTIYEENYYLQCMGNSVIPLNAFF